MALASQQSERALEYQVKAAYLLNFARFVEWPPRAFQTAGSALNICVLGEDPFGPALDSIVEGETVNDRRIEAKRLARGDSMRGCHVLFISGTERESAERIVASLRNAPVLTVSEMPGFARLGGMINFVLEERKVRFEANPAAAEKGGLRISSKLLKVARSVRMGDR